MSTHDQTLHLSLTLLYLLFWIFSLSTCTIYILALISPFYVRPIPLFEIGFFKIEPSVQKRIVEKYGSILDELDSSKNICSVNLKRIWEYKFNDKYSFPKFKYMLYSKDDELNFEYKEVIVPALSIDVDFQKDYMQKFLSCINALKAIINRSIREEKFYDIEGDDSLVNELMKQLHINIYKSRSIIDTIISAMSVFQRDYSKNIHSKMFMAKPLKSGEVKYKFMNGASSFFRWLENGFNNINNIGNCETH